MSKLILLAPSFFALPIVFDRDGDLPVLPCEECAFATHIDNSGMTSAEFHRAYADQVHYLNGRVIESIDGILRNAPDAVVILFSDHGSRANREVDADWFATFFAARTPGHDATFPDDVRPIEIFPRLFAALFGDTLAIPEDRNYVVPEGFRMPLDFVPADPVEQQ